MKIRIILRDEPLVSPRATAALTLVAVLVGMAVAGLLFLPFEAGAIEGYAALIGNAFLSMRGIGYTLVAATSLMLVAFGTIAAWRCGVLFLGFEGCLLIGAMGATMVALYAVEGAVFAEFPPVILITMALVWGPLLAAVWAGVVGELKTRFGGNEVLIALMMNFLAIYLVQSLVVGPWRVDGDLPQTIRFRRDMWLPGTRLHAGILIAVVVGVAVHVLLTRTRAGFEMLAAGLNDNVALYGGLSVGGDAMQRQTGLPSSIVVVVQSIIVLSMLAFEMLRTHRIVITRPLQKKER